jgi:hypothetical protein
MLVVCIKSMHALLKHKVWALDRSLTTGLHKEMFLSCLWPSGSTAAGLLKQVLQRVGGAFANKDNLTRLAERCTDLLGLLAGHLDPASQHAGGGTDAAQQLKVNRAYVSLMGRFKDLLEVSGALAK